MESKTEEKRAPTEAEMFMALEIKDKVDIHVWEAIGRLVTDEAGLGPIINKKKQAAKNEFIDKLVNDYDFAWKLAQSYNFRQEFIRHILQDISIQNEIIDIVKQNLQSQWTTQNTSSTSY